MKRTRRTLTALAILVGGALANHVAAAQPSHETPLVTPPAAPTPLDLQEAQTRYEEAKVLFKQGREEEALIKFRESYALSGRLSALFGIARTEQLTNHLVDAATHFKQFLANPSAKATGNGGKDDARTYLDQVLKQLTHLAIEAPSGATLKLDGKSLGPAEREVYALPGNHTLEGSLDGRSDRQETGTIAAGGSITVKLFQASRAAPPPEVSAVSPAPSSASQTTVPIGSPPSADAGSTGGTFWTTRKVFALGLGVGAVAGLGVGAGFGVASQNEKNNLTSLQANPSCATGCSDLENARAAQRQDGNIANAMYIVGGVLAAGSLAFVASLALWPDKPGSAQAIVYPLFTNGGGGVAVHALF